MFGKIIFKKNLLLVWMAVLIFLISQVFAAVPSFTEQFYSRGFYPFFASMLSTISCWFPFSLDDIFYTLLIACLFILLILVVFRKIKLKDFGLLLLNSSATLFILFYVLWGYNYFREDFNTRLNIPEVPANKKNLLDELEHFIEETNNAYLPVNSINRVAIDSVIEASYKEHAEFLRIPYPAGMRRPKSITYGSFFSKAMISGYYGPFFNEVHINNYVLPVEYPMVLAHEKAHQFGITSEAEANFYAWLVCMQSGDQRAKYSANLYLLRYFYAEAARFEESREIAKKLSEDVRQDYARIRKHWMSLRNEKIDRVAGHVNDAYLKANKVEKGIEDYSGVVKFIMDYRGSVRRE